MRSSLVLLLVPLFGLFQCGPITLPANPDTYNTCNDDKTCDGYCARKSLLCEVSESRPACKATRSGGNACLAGQKALPSSLVLVVDVPGGSQYAPGQTFVLTSESIVASQDAARGECSPLSSPACCQFRRQPDAICVPLPPLAGIEFLQLEKGPFQSALSTFGYYKVAENFGHDIGVHFGLLNGATETLPAAVTLTPSWTVAATNFHAPPWLVGLPIPVMEGSIVGSTASPFIVNPAAPGGPPHGSGPALGWVNFAFDPAVLPAGLSYSEAIEVLPPFADVPPVVNPPAPVDPWFPDQSGNPFAMPTPVCVDLPPSEVPDGWTLFFREAFGQRVLSSVTGLRKISSCKEFGANVYSFVDLSMPSTESIAPNLVVSPPAGAVRPQLIEPSFGSEAHTFYNVPKPAKVRGRVVFAGKNVSAELHFVSTSLYTAKGSGCLREPAPSLFYDVVVATDPMRVGEYDVLLPEGEYAVTVNPDPGSGAPQTLLPRVALPVDAKSCPAPEEGIVLPDLVLDNAIGVSGTVALPGTMGPLLDATVDLTPSLATINPMFPPPVPASSIDSPRSFETTTDAGGRFAFKPPDALVGAGTYDITVRPLDGTNLPWVVFQTRQISATMGGDLGTFTVPAPASLTVTLHDLADGAIVGALVRAYAFPPCPTSACFDPAHQIGESITDDTGTFQMFLAPAPFVTPTSPPTPKK
jgi:hypothetical protein